MSISLNDLFLVRSTSNIVSRPVELNTLCDKYSSFSLLSNNNLPMYDAEVSSMALLLSLSTHIHLLPLSASQMSLAPLEPKLFELSAMDSSRSDITIIQLNTSPLSMVSLLQLKSSVRKFGILATSSSMNQMQSSSKRMLAKLRCWMGDILSLESGSMAESAFS